MSNTVQNRVTSIIIPELGQKVYSLLSEYRELLVKVHTDYFSDWNPKVDPFWINSEVDDRMYETKWEFIQTPFQILVGNKLSLEMGDFSVYVNSNSEIDLDSDFIDSLTTEQYEVVINYLTNKECILDVEKLIKSNFDNFGDEEFIKRYMNTYKNEGRIEYI